MGQQPRGHTQAWTTIVARRLTSLPVKMLGKSKQMRPAPSTCLSCMLIDQSARVWSYRVCFGFRSMFAPVSRRAHRRRVSRAPNSRPSCREALCKVLDLTCSSLGRVDRLHHASRRPPVKLSMVSDSVLSMASLNLVSLAAVLFLL